MINAITGLAIKAGKNIVGALVGRKMLIWALERYSKSTKTKVDDNGVMLLKGGLENDPEKIKLAVKNLADIWLD